MTEYQCIAIMDKKPRTENKGDNQDASLYFWQNRIYGYDDEHGHDDVHAFCDVHMDFVIVLRDFFTNVNQTARKMRAVFYFSNGNADSV